MQQVEESFNFVWRVEQPRSIGRRFSEYLSVMVVGPTVIVAALGLIATIGSTTFVETLSHYRPFDTVLLILGRITPYLLVSGVFTFMYGFIPNTKVRLRAALIGGVAAGAAWAFSGMVMAQFVSSASTTMVIYAGFAIVIVALIWLYISWLILLLGAQLAFYVQNPQYLRPGRGLIALNSSMREASRAVHHVSHRQRLPDGTASLDGECVSPNIWICRERHSRPSWMRSSSASCCWSRKTTAGCRRAIRTQSN